MASYRRRWSKLWQVRLRRDGARKSPVRRAPRLPYWFVPRGMQELEDRRLLAADFLEAPQKVADFAAGPSSVFVADLNGDGDLDVITAEVDGDRIVWYRNEGGNVFDEQEPISELTDFALSAYAADLDNDGDQDVVSASLFGDQQVAWYENNGPGTFQAPRVLATDGGATEVFVADVDGDGLLDVLASFNFANKIAWYRNQGNDVFSAERVVSSNAVLAEQVYAADVDGDGDMDVLSASQYDNKIAWYENDGAENFAERVISTNASGAYSVYAADVDGDGDIDVLSASRNDDKIAWYENNGSENFTERVISTNADGAVWVQAADIDADGDMDVISASQYDDTIAWHENNGNQVFTKRPVSAAVDRAVSVRPGDMDDDGDLDLVAVARNGDHVTLFVNSPSSSGAPTDVTLTPSHISENTDTSLGPVTVGALVGVDPDTPSGEIIYTIVGGADAAKLQIDNNQLRVKQNVVIDFEAQAQYQVEVQVSDGAGTFTKTLTVQVDDINESPVISSLSPSSVNENADTSQGLLVGTIVATDPETPAENLLYEIVGGADAASFQIQPTAKLFLKPGVVLDFETKSQYEVIVRASDGVNPVQETFTVTVNDLIESGFPWHNADEPADIDGVGGVTIRDLLLVVNDARLNGLGRNLPPPTPGNSPPPYVDANPDNILTLRDVLVPVQFLRNAAQGQNPEGEPSPPAQAAPAADGWDFLLTNIAEDRRRREHENSPTATPKATGPVGVFSTGRKLSDVRKHVVTAPLLDSDTAIPDDPPPLANSFGDSSGFVSGCRRNSVS